MCITGSVRSFQNNSISFRYNWCTTANVNLKLQSLEQQRADTQRPIKVWLSELSAGLFVRQICGCTMGSGASHSLIHLQRKQVSRYYLNHSIKSKKSTSQPLFVYTSHMLVYSILIFVANFQIPFCCFGKASLQMLKCKDDVRGIRNWRQTILSLSARWAAMCNELSLSKYSTKYREKPSSRWKLSPWTNLFCQILSKN